MYADVNDVTPMKNVTTAGDSGIDFSKRSFTYTQDYQLIKEGENELTTKISCYATGNPTPLYEWHTVNVTGVSVHFKQDFISETVFSHLSHLIYYNSEGKIIEILLNYEENNINCDYIHDYQLMSEEGGSINENTDLSNGDEVATPREPEAVPELVPEPEVEIISSVREEGGIDEAATGEAMREQTEPIGTSTVKQPQLAPQTKPKKQTTNNLMKIESSLADASKQIEKQTIQINKINQNLQPLQKQLRVGEKQSEIVNQIRSKVYQIQKQISQAQKIIQKRSSAISQKSSKKRSKSKSNK